MTFCFLCTNCVVYDKQTNTAGVAGANGICYGCEDAMRSDLTKLRLDYVDLSQIIAKQGVISDAQIHRPKPESSPPINMAAFTLRGQIAYFVRLVATVIRRREKGINRPLGPMREGFLLDHDIRYLVEHTHLIAAMPATEHYWDVDNFALTDMIGPEVVEELRRLHRRAREACGLEPPIINVPGDCPQCQTPGLRRSADDDDKLWCQHCKTKLSGEQYSRAMKLQVLGEEPRMRIVSDQT